MPATDTKNEARSRIPPVQKCSNLLWSIVSKNDLMSKTKSEANESR